MRPPKTNRKRRLGHDRGGSAALMLILILTLLVGSFATTMVQRVSDERRTALQHQSISMLESAIDSAERFELTKDDTIRLPVTEYPERWITIESITDSDSKTIYLATLSEDAQPGLSIRRLKRNES